MPRNSVTVCAGISCEKATRNEICKGMVPAIIVRLKTDGQKGRTFHEAHRETYVQLILPVMAYSKTKMPKVSRLGTREVRSRNFANSADVQALSRYLPP